MSVIGEPALFVFMDLLIEKLTDSAINFVNDHKQVRQQLKEWQSILKKIQAVLDDAEEKQIKDKEVKSWLADLQDLAYDVDDVLDEYAYEELRLKLQKTQSQASTGKVRELIPACCTGSNFSPTTFTFNNKMITNIKEITDRLNNLESQMNVLKLREIPGASALMLSKGMKPRLQPTSLLNESIVYVGREQEKKEILELLRSSDGANEGAYVISIVGMGGLGKTTLAQLVFNDTSLLNYCDLKAWVCVSDDFDAINITKNILTSITSGSYEGNDLNNLQVKLKESISGKRLLLVLDDVWNENYNDLFILLSPFGAGTKIIVTTRSKSVSSKMIAKKSFILEKLSHDDCLPIFTQHALGATNFNGHPEFKEVGENIVRRCKGLPLAAKAIGGLLRTVLNLDAWKNILESEIWDLPEDQCDILPALQLSYHHLPSPLKRCFAYCSILPKDYEFEEEEIILLWRAEGFLKHKVKGQLKHVGSQYFHELVSRSFFQISSKDKSRYVMHDLINNLAQLVATDICSKLESDKMQKFSARTRHSSYVGGRYDGVKKFEFFDEARNLRTFLPLKLPDHLSCYLTSVVLEDLLPGLGHLRVLSLSGYGITELPDFFDNLKHLRYLNFSGTEIKNLPNSICTLYHLETLILRGCRRLEKLPQEMGNLSELHHLDIRGASSIKRMPFGMDKLINLQRLSDFILGASEGYRLREIKNFSNLRGDFCLSGLDNIIKEEDALEAKLSEKLGIEELKLKWSADFDDNERNKVDEEKVLNFICPPKELNKLSIMNYRGINFSAWIRDPFLNCLSSLMLINCKNCKSLPSIGQLPKLKEVFVEGMDGLTKIGVELFGGNQSNTFASLESLHFDDMPNWEEWDCCETDEKVSKFPNLCELSIQKCPQLRGRLPNHLPSLRTLVIYRCEKLVVLVSSLPLLCELALDGCDELINIEDSGFKSLKNVSLFDISKYNIANGREQEIQPEEVEVEVDKISRIESLTIAKCEKLLYKLSTVLHSFTFLSEIQLYNCWGLVSLSEFYFPPLLKMMQIAECENLLYLVDERENMKGSLLPENLTIDSCDSLVLLSPRDDVAVRLQHLRISACLKLSCLFSNNKLPIMLKELSIFRCPKLESIALEFEETACLESIYIWHGKSVKIPQGLLKLSHIQRISLENCSSEVTLEVEENRLPTHLRILSIVRCPNFAALPKSINNFTSLSHLAVNCRADICFPEEGFPTTLSNLSISAAPKLYRSIVKWGFYKLTCLQELCIGGKGCIDVMSFPETGMMLLPPSLTEISISDFENLECISSEGFRNLTSLETLYISRCPKLTSPSEKGMLLSLGKLFIRDCPLLKEEYCNGNKGREWSKIAHIPYVEIDDKTIIPRGLERGWIEGQVGI